MISASKYFKCFKCFLCVGLVLGCGSGDPSAERASSSARNPHGVSTSTVHSPQLASIPLQQQGAPESRRFARLKPDQTGVDFVHRWRPPKHDYDFRTLLNGGGVCLGDYDGDGLTDIYLTRPDGGNRLYRNLGGFKFRDVTAAANLDDPMWGMGATFADIDNDGDLDLYACAFQAPNRLYVNQGDGRFEEQAAKAGVDFNGASIMLAMADYDNDGRLDGYLVTNREQIKELADFDRRAREGFHLDPENKTAYFDEEFEEFMTALILPEGKVFPTMAGQYDRLFRNTGEGRFEELAKPSGIEGNDIGLAATWWDYNADGLPDLYVSNDFLGPDRLYRNNGDGQFEDVAREALPHTPWSSMGADVADVNNDGRLDFMASDMSSTSHYRSKVTMGDMSNMGWFLEWAEPRQYMRNAVYLNTGAERLMEAAHQTGLASTDWTWSVKWADLDDDGRVDLFVTNGMTRDWENADFVAEVEALGGYHSPAGQLFWLNQEPSREKNLAFRNQGDLHFEATADQWGLDHLGVSFGAALGDLDGDGDLDLVVNNYEEPVAIYRNDLAEGHRVKIRLVGTTSNRWGIGATVRIEAGDATQAQYLTLARGFMSSDEPLVHFGLGDAETIDRLTVQWPSGHKQTFDGLAADRFYTITEPPGAPAEPAGAQPQPSPAEKPLFARFDGLSEAVHQEQIFDDFRSQPLLPHKLSQLGPGHAWGDLDGDGRDDLFVGGAAGQSGYVLRNLGAGRFEVATDWMPAEFEEDAAYEDMGVLVFDAEGDGDNDVYVVSGGVECPAESDLLCDRLYLNNGQGKFEKAREAALPEVLDSGGVVAAADFDRDGDLDLFVGGRVVPSQYPVAPRSRLLRNDSTRDADGGSAQFSDATDELAPELLETGLVTSAVWSDADGDGWIDLLVTHDWGPVKLFHNDQGRLVDRTEGANLADRLGWYNGIAAGDVDNDGDIDYVVTNAGLNTKYHASRDEPVQIYYGDFEGSGEMRIVEAKYKGDQLLPVRGKSCSQNAIPMVRSKFPKYHDFAAALLPDIYTDECLDDALKVEANDLRSGVLINDGSARFTFQPLPSIAQVAPAYGAALADVDADGRLDLYLAQNSYSPQRETGHMDGGVSLLLLGQGDGTFTPVWPSDSGLVVPRDAKSLSSADVNDDGWPDWVVGVNNGPLRAFTHSGRAQGNLVRVLLRGGRGNATGVGALVTAEFSDGRSLVAEVAAGGGYLSQSPSVLNFGLSPSGRVEKLRVRWPDGAETTHTGSDESVEIRPVDAVGQVPPKSI